MNTAEQEKRLDQMRTNYHTARSHLLMFVTELCPGPHRLTVHRDKQPPWCDACGRDLLGYRRRSDT